MRIPFIGITFILFMISCKEKKSGTPLAFENDAEPHEWIGNITIKDILNAHSGAFASVTDSIHPFSLGLRKKLKDIKKERIKTVAISYWVFLKKSNSKANTVCSIDTPGKNIFWAGRSVDQKVNEYNKWIQINESFDLPQEALPEHELSVYLWNNSKEEILVDDLKIIFN